MVRDMDDTHCARTWREVATEFTRRTGTPLTPAAARNIFDRGVRKMRRQWHRMRYERIAAEAAEKLERERRSVA